MKLPKGKKVIVDLATTKGYKKDGIWASGGKNLTGGAKIKLKKGNILTFYYSKGDRLYYLMVVVK